MANTLNLGTDGNWGTKEGSVLGYNSENKNYKPLPFSFDRASSATVINKEGLIETVGSGEPRIDFKDDSKGALLLEPTRSNLNTYSDPTIAQQGNLSYASVTYQDNYSWGLGNVINNAIVFGDNSTTRYAYYNSTVVSGTEYALSFIIKMDDNSVPIPATDFLMVLAGTSFASGYNVESYGNNIYRISVSGTAGASNTANGILKVASNSTKGFKISGFQIEQGSYATSYIPTNGSVVTRVGDSSSQTVPDGVIGQTEGTVFLDITRDSLELYTQRILTLSNGTTNNVIGLQLTAANQITFYVENGGSNQVVISKNNATISNQKVKIAAAYKSNDFVMYIDGVQVGVDTSGSVPTTNVIKYENPNGGLQYVGVVNDLRLYNTRLSNSELAALTS